MMNNTDIKKDEIKVRNAVRDHYAKAVTQSTGCCGGSSKNDDSKVKRSSDCGCSPQIKIVEKSDSNQLYEAKDLEGLPEEVTDISLGCGDPVTLASLKEGQTVLDLGSGGGIDCFIAGKKVGPNGYVIGVDMTAEMLDRARSNKEKIGAENVEFRLGEIEHLPVADNTVDVVISNCVINLSTDKPQVIREIMRVLKPGGKMAVSDIVTSSDLPEEISKNMSAWAGCVAGAIPAEQMIEIMKETSFVDIELKPEYFSKEMVEEFSGEFDLSKYDRENLAKSIFSAKISAKKS